MKLYGAIDLHSNNNVTVVIDEQDQVVYQKRLPNELGLITEQLSGYRDRLQGIVVESTYNWYWLVDGLMEHGHRVHLANTAAIQQYEGLKYTDDISDARWLAHILRLGVLPEGYIYPKEERAVRDLLRKRSQMVRQRTTNLLSIQNLITRNTGSSLNGNRIKTLGAQQDFKNLILNQSPPKGQTQIKQHKLSLRYCLTGIPKKGVDPDGLDSYTFGLSDCKHPDVHRLQFLRVRSYFRCVRNCRCAAQSRAWRATHLPKPLRPLLRQGTWSIRPTLRGAGPSSVPVPCSCPMGCARSDQGEDMVLLDTLARHKSTRLKLWKRFLLHRFVATAAGLRLCSCHQLTLVCKFSRLPTCAEEGC
jgi:hypothetical protein